MWVAVQKSLNLFDKFLQLMAVVLFVVMAMSIFWQVISRYLTEQSSTWTGEVSTAAFVWLAMIAIALGVRRSRHLSMDVWAYLPKSRILENVISTIAFIAVMFVLFLFVRFGIQGLGPSFSKVFPGIGIAYGWMTLAVPVGFAISMVFAVEAWISGLLNRGQIDMPLLGEDREELQSGRQE